MTGCNLSIVIPSYNSENVLKNTLLSIQKQKTEYEYEVIIVDSSSSVAVDELCKLFTFVKLIKQNKKTLPGEARNIGGQMASGELLLFCDSDVYLNENVVTEAWQYYNKGNKIFGGALAFSKDSTFPTGLMEHLFFNHESQIRRPESRRKNLSSALMCIEKKLFIESGGFKNIPRMQDTELTERICKKGISLSFNPKVVGNQLQDSSWKAVCRKIFVNGNNLFFIRYSENSNIFKLVFLFIFLPMLSIFKITRINVRNFIYHRSRERLLVLFTVPAMYYLGFLWMLGFYKAIILKNGISRER